MLPQLLSVLLSNPLTIAAALSPVLINSINNNRARVAAKAKYEEEELNQAHKINDLQAWDGYRKQILEWNSLITKRRAEMEVYFGEDTRKTFYRVKQLIEYIESIINAAFLIKIKAFILSTN